MIKRLKAKLIYWLARKLLPIVAEKDIIAFTKNGKVFIDGKELNATELNSLRTEADVIGQMRLWQIVVNELNKKSQVRMYRDAVDIIDLLFGKTVLYTLNLQKEIIDKLKH